MEDKTVVSTRTVTANFNGDEVETPADTRGAIFYIRINTASGTTPTCVLKLQQKDPLSGQWSDVAGATTASLTTTTNSTIEVYPGLLAVANRKVNGLLGKTLRVVGTIGGTTPSFNLSVSANFMK